MKPEILRSRKNFSAIAFLMILLPFFSTLIHAQGGKEVSLSVYAGYTLVNFEEALGYSDDDMDDWNEIYFSAALRGFLTSGKPFNLGAEIAYNQLYYAYYIIPYGMQTIYREFNISTFSLTALGRYRPGNFFLVGGLGIHFFNDGVAPSLTAEAGYTFNQEGKIKVPLSFKINPVFGDGTPVTFSIGIGAVVSLK